MPKMKSAPHNRQVATPKVRAREPLFNPYAQCLCDLPNSDGEASLPEELFVRLLHENGETSSHLPNCDQLRTVRSKMSSKPKSPLRPAQYLDLEEEERKKAKADTRKENDRRRRKEAKKSRDAEIRAEATKAVKEAKKSREAEIRAEAMKAVKPAGTPHAQCHCYDALSCSEDEDIREFARTIRHTHTDGSTTFHLPNCRTRRLDYATHRKSHNSPRKSAPKSAPYICTEEKEDRTKIRKKRDDNRRQPKSVAYIDLEEEEKAGIYGPVSPPAKRYDTRTIASDFLRAIGEHPYLPPLNAHILGFSRK